MSSCREAWGRTSLPGRRTSEMEVHIKTGRMLEGNERGNIQPSIWRSKASEGCLTAQPRHCAMAVMRKHQSNPAWSTRMPPKKADPLHPKAVNESTALHLPLFFCSQQHRMSAQQGKVTCQQVLQSPCCRNATSLNQSEKTEQKLQAGWPLCTSLDFSIAGAQSIYQDIKDAYHVDPTVSLL